MIVEHSLTLIWFAIIAFGVFMYVFMDGFVLGIGILFGLKRSEADRDILMNSVAPIWDGNETWLVLGGAGLFAAFPLAYAVVLPALYLPLLAMLIALVFRGVAFEFRFKAKRRQGWDLAFTLGLLVATFAQGVALGAFVQGFSVWEAASPPETQAFMLVGVIVLIPIILGYTAYSYWIFRGKITQDMGYH